MPTFGLHIYLPAFTAGASVGTATENSAVSEGTPATTFVSSEGVLKAGSLTVSQQYLDPGWSRYGG